MRKNKDLSWVWPDGKSQVSVVYEDSKPKKIDTVVISTQHSPDISMSQLREEIIDKVIRPVVAVGLIIKPNFLLILQEGL